MAFRQTTIATRLLGAFAALLIGTLAAGTLSIRFVDRMADTTATILDHPFAVSVAAADLRAELLSNQTTLTRLARSTDPAAIRRSVDMILQGRAKVTGELGTLRTRYLGPAQDVEDLAGSLGSYRAAADRVMAQAGAGHHAEALVALETEADPLASAAVSAVQKVSLFAAAKAALLQRQGDELAARAFRTTLWILLALAGLSILVAVVIIASIGSSLKQAARIVAKLVNGGKDKVLAAEAVAAGDLDSEIQVSPPLRLDLSRLPEDDLGRLIRGLAGLNAIQTSLDASFRKMTGSLRRAREEARRAQWLKSGLVELDGLMRGEQAEAQMARSVLSFLAGYLEAGAAALYLFRERSQDLELAAGFATGRKGPVERIRLGEGLVGQAARDERMITLDDVPRDYFAIESSLGAGAPGTVVAVPFSHDGKLIGALELATFKPFTATDLSFLREAMEVLAIGFQVSSSRQQVNELLHQSQSQEEELRVQQEELQQSNEELEERTHLLEQQRGQIESKSREVERVSAYKSQFLANMSHELRTPLNSLMILSGILRDNKEANLTARQVEYAATINSAGRDLLELINDILDLSKIEAGRVEYSIQPVSPADICAQVESAFRPQAEQKGLAFSVELDGGIPALLGTDLQRCHQILKNLVANALKFTARGAVGLRVHQPAAADNPLPVPALAFTVADTGIGIPAAKFEAVFQPFHQVDGTTSRKFGGTGLGLSISRQLARGLQGEILLASEEGVGTQVTLYLPLALEAAPKPVVPPPAPPRPAPKEALPAAAIADDRHGLKPGERAILVIEDDLAFAQGLLELVRERGFKAVAAADGPSGLALAASLQPSAIILDVMLPGLDGWEVMRSLAENLRTRHIPVHFLSCLEERQKAMAMGAIGYVTKPATSEELDSVLATIEEAVTGRVKKLLIVEDDPGQAESLVALLEEREIGIQVAPTGAEAIRLLEAEPFDCIVLDLGLSDMSGFDLLAHIQRLDEKRRIPVIIHSGRELSREDENRLQRYAETIIIKGAKSPERLLNEVTLFLHVVDSSLPPEKQRMLRTAQDAEAVFDGRKVLIADDDMRNVFALSSLLAGRNMTIVEAENGREALARLEEHPDTKIVLMDIMMPEMDGYQAIRAIRQDPRFRRLPVIALTAKAMKGDREACMAAGASDYISKPIDPERLLSLLRVWLYNA